MTIYLGIDVGAVSIKAAVVLPRALADRLPVGEGSRSGMRRLLTARNQDDLGGSRLDVADGQRDVGRDVGTAGTETGRYGFGPDGGQDARASRRTAGTETGRDRAVLTAQPRRTRGRPLEVSRELLEDLLADLPVEQIAGLMLTGSGAALVAKALGSSTCNEFQACARAIDELHPRVRTVLSIGGETSRYLRLGPDPGSGRLSILDYSMNGDCAAGTGAFLDQQAARLQYAVEDVGTVVTEAQRAAQIAGRCSVFAKSDMIHAQQKGFRPPEVLRGLCHAVATNFKSAVVRGRPTEPPVMLIGGVSANTAVVAALREVLELSEQELLVPEAAESLDAVGAALLAAESGGADTVSVTARLRRLSEAVQGDGYSFPAARPLTLERVRRLGGPVRPYQFPGRTPIDAYLGIDVGSVGTKLALIDEQGEVIYSIFTRTDGRPIEVVTRCLRETEEAVGWGVRIRAVGTTGSGRELVGELVGADSINDEITAHKTGATFVGDRLLGRRPDTIFEVGGQDSKYISLEPEGGGSTDTVVVDFTMNEACAAGTGSFLEERAAELGVSIKGEFSELALRSRAPIRLGERCTVFMERDVNTYMQRGALRDDVLAGLAYSIAYNYINRVVRGRPVGDCVFFQGGTAYNDAVAAAFSIICDKEIIIPPHNAVLGAIGVALLAKEKVVTTGASARFRGYDLERVNYALREFTCKGCGNHCSIQEFNVEGEKTFWGDKCSERYRKQAKTERKPVIPDLVALREELLQADPTPDPPHARLTIGLPLAMYTWDTLPLWRRFFRECGFRVVVSGQTNRVTVHHGLECSVAEPCFPIIVAHGHVAELVERGVDYLWLPNLTTAAGKLPGLENCVCPWGTTLPFVIGHAPRFRSWAGYGRRDHGGHGEDGRRGVGPHHGRILCPTLSLQRGTAAFRRVMVQLARELGVRRGVARRAFEAALSAQQQFVSAYEEAGLAALETLRRTGEPGLVLVGRPYNIHDAGVSLAVARKLREQYGVNVLPIDALPLAAADVSDVNSNMYWAYGRRILGAAKLAAQCPNLHLIYITNFKCGPDSFLKGFIRPASGKPFLTLQFDGHSNDAGMMTRCEAYLDSKGILRWWRTCRSQSATELLPGEPSTSPRCPMPVPG